jgi:hypothetical protein
VEFQGVLEARQSVFFGFALTRDVYVKALGDVPLAFLPYAGGKGSLLIAIISHTVL